MTQNLSDAAPSAARPSAAPGFPAAGPALIAAAHALLPSLEAGRPVDAAALRHAMECVVRQFTFRGMRAAASNWIDLLKAR